ncbi:unnamed protein product [Merluccius merluccius]
MSEDDCRSPIGLDCCSCCLDLANGSDYPGTPGHGSGPPGPGSPSSPSVSHFRQLRDQLVYENLNRDKLSNIMRQDSLESVVRDPCFLLNEGICNSNIDQTMLSILLFFHSASGASVVAIDNKIEQAMDLVKNHLMYAVREEVEVLKEQIKELAEKNNQLERENSLLKNLASPEQMEKFQSRVPADELLALDNQSSQSSGGHRHHHHLHHHPSQHLLHLHQQQPPQPQLPCSLSAGSAVGGDKGADFADILGEGGVDEVARRGEERGRGEAFPCQEFISPSHCDDRQCQYNLFLFVPLSTSRPRSRDHMRPAGKWPPGPQGGSQTQMGYVNPAFDVPAPEELQHNEL